MRTESAYYEYICRRAGIQVSYCAEQFENAVRQSPLSLRVSNERWPENIAESYLPKYLPGSCRLIELGFRQGGPAGYGLRRVLIDNRVR